MCISFENGVANEAIVQWAIRTASWDIKVVKTGRESSAFIDDSEFEQSLVNVSSANTAYIYWRSLWGQTCSSWIDGNLQLKHAPAAKKGTNKIFKKKHSNVARCRDDRSGRDDSINSSVYNPTLHILNSEKICRVELCTELFYAIISTLFPCFLRICYPYILQ